MKGHRQHIFKKEMQKPRSIIAFNNPHRQGFAGTDPEAVVLNVIGQTESELNLAMYRFLNKNILKALCEAAERNVKIHIVLDSNLENGEQQEVFMNEIAVELKELQCRHPGMVIVKFMPDEFVMHHKMLISDRKVLLTGSYNYTNAANSKNFENLVMIHACDHPDILHHALAEFFGMMEMPFVGKPLELKGIRIDAGIILGQVFRTLFPYRNQLLKKGMLLEIELEVEGMREAELHTAGGNIFRFKEKSVLFEPSQTQRAEVVVYGLDGSVEKKKIFIRVQPLDFPHTKEFREFLNDKFRALRACLKQENTKHYQDAEKI
ncbi:MAG: phospholipase D-like domain-containing protein [Bacteroidia bacterium]|nr:phospholipase D-like domain-containing protein [Bacteroidia bacterium]